MSGDLFGIPFPPTKLGFQFLRESGKSPFSWGVQESGCLGHSLALAGQRERRGEERGDPPSSDHTYHTCYWCHQQQTRRKVRWGEEGGWWDQIHFHISSKDITCGQANKAHTLFQCWLYKKKSAIRRTTQKHTENKHTNRGGMVPTCTCTVLITLPLIKAILTQLPQNSQCIDIGRTQKHI